MDEKISLVFDSNLNFLKTDSQWVTWWQWKRSSGGPPASQRKYYIINRRIHLGSWLSTDTFALVSLTKLGSRTAHEAALPQNFIFLCLSSNLPLRGGTGDHLQFQHFSKEQHHRWKLITFRFCHDPWHVCYCMGEIYLITGESTPSLRVQWITNS